MHKYLNYRKLSPQFVEIFNFRNELTLKTGREISLSEAIAQWIALGYAEEFREKTYLANN